MSELVVDIRDVHKSYRRGGTDTPVLQGVDLEVCRGEIVFLTGPSGCGKSTLLSILGCILTPDRGHVAILGQSLAGLSKLQLTMLRRETVGFVFQRFNLIRGLTAVDNVCLPRLLRGDSQRQAKSSAMRLLSEVGLDDKARSLPDNLSAGQCQRVALARALAGDPDLILADEPTASLDAKSGQQVVSLIRLLTKRHGRTAIIVTHDSRVYSSADRILAMEQGQLRDVELPVASSGLSYQTVDLTPVQVHASSTSPV